MLELGQKPHRKWFSRCLLPKNLRASQMGCQWNNFWEEKEDFFCRATCFCLQSGFKNMNTLFGRVLKPEHCNCFIVGIFQDLYMIFPKDTLGSEKKVFVMHIYVASFFFPWKNLRYVRCSSIKCKSHLQPKPTHKEKPRGQYQLAPSLSQSKSSLVRVTTYGRWFFVLTWGS